MAPRLVRARERSRTVPIALLFAASGGDEAPEACGPWGEGSCTSGARADDPRPGHEGVAAWGAERGDARAAAREEGEEGGEAPHGRPGAEE